MLFGLFNGDCLVMLIILFMEDYKVEMIFCVVEVVKVYCDEY